MMTDRRVRHPRTGKTAPFPGSVTEAVRAICGRCDQDCRDCELIVEETPMPRNDEAPTETIVPLNDRYRFVICATGDALALDRWAVTFERLGRDWPWTKARWHDTGVLETFRHYENAVNAARDMVASPFIQRRFR